MEVAPMVVRCRDCKRWKKAAGVGNRRRCPATGRMKWAGDIAEECSRLVCTLQGKEVAC